MVITMGYGGMARMPRKAIGWSGSIPKSIEAVLYRRVHTSVQNLTTKIFFSNNELHTIFNRRNLEICKHSIFFQLLNKNMVNGTLKIGLFIDISWETFIALLV